MQNTVNATHVQMAPAGQPCRKSSRVKSIFTTGIFQIIGGTIIVLCGLLLVCIRYYISYRNNFDNSICGIWGGTMVLVTGIVGVLAANRRKWVSAYMVCSLVSIVLLIIVTAIGAVAAAANVHYWKEHPGYHQYDDPDYPDQHGVSITKLAFHLILCVVGSLELVVCILAAVFCCTVICPGDSPNPTVSYQAAPMAAPAIAYHPPPNYAYPPQPQPEHPPQPQPEHPPQPQPEPK